MQPRNPFERSGQLTQPGITSLSNAAFMSQVYFWMMVGVFITAVTSYIVANNTLWMQTLLQSKGLFIGLIIAEFLAVIALSAFIRKMSLTLALFFYVLYATLTGVTFSVLLIAYTAESVSTAFFLTSFSFAGLSLFGYFTKRDLGPIGSFCTIGLFGLIGIMFLSFFIPSLMSNSVQLAISVLGVVIFAGLTAYDTQKIKSMNSPYDSMDGMKKSALLGALILYLDFINLFINILRIMGSRRD